MTSKQWYYAQLRWAVMVEGKEGLREWKEAVHIFRSEDVQTAFQQALHIGRLGEDVHTEGRREVETRLAEVVRLIFYSLSVASACKSLILLKTVVKFCKM